MKTKYGKITYFTSINNQITPTILFIHGSGGNHLWFADHFITYPISTYSWIVPSLFGYDTERKPHILEAFSMEQFVEDLIILIKEENVKDLIIMGHSMGGKIGVLLSEKILTEDFGINLIAFYNLEGPLVIEELDIDDISIGKSHYSEFEKQFALQQANLMEKNDILSKKMVETNNFLGSYLIWAVFHNFTVLLEENNLFNKILQTRKLTEYLYVYGEKNKERLPTKQLYLNNGFETIEIPRAGHIMMSEQPNIFWNLILNSLTNLEYREKKISSAQ